jgi:poly-gamma-glutamate synthesis protein (capsule biosynthesis protein)
MAGNAELRPAPGTAVLDERVRGEIKRMQRIAARIIPLSLIVLALAFWGGSSRSQPPKNQEVPNGQSQGEKKFLDFSNRKKELPQAKEEISLIAVGDVSFSRGVERAIKKQKDVNYPFLKMSDYLKSGDVVFGNLETPITQGREISDFEMIFRSNPGTEQALKQAGFSVLSLANNHTLNFGERGIEDTFRYLDEAGIAYAGAGRNEQEAYQPIYIEAKGITFAFLAYSDDDLVPASYEAGENRAGAAFMRMDRMAEGVKEAKQKADFVVVSMHAGTEYADEPNGSQIRFAHAAIDAGADLIIGHHPHVVQTLEKYKGKYIFYSLGNFVFDQPQWQKTKEGLAVKAYVTKDGVNKISFLPVVMENLAQPRMANEDEAEKILQKLKYSLANQYVYSWDGKDGFEKELGGVLYEEASGSGNVLSGRERADVDGNSIPENYVLENGGLTITENSEMIWQSPHNWWIDDFVLADSNDDGVTDIHLSLWKSGSFGASRPFWIKEDDASVKNHFFILDFIDGSIKQVWGSSNLSRPNCEFQIADIDDDGKNDLIVIEGEYSQKPECSGNHVAVWKWNGWGFSNEWRSEEGNFSNLEIEKIGGKNYMIVDAL